MRLEKIRINLGLSRADFCTKIGINQTGYSRIRKADKSNSVLRSAELLLEVENLKKENEVLKELFEAKTKK